MKEIEKLISEIVTIPLKKDRIEFIQSRHNIICKKLKEKFPDLNLSMITSLKFLNREDQLLLAQFRTLEVFKNSLTSEKSILFKGNPTKDEIFGTDFFDPKDIKIENIANWEKWLMQISNGIVN